MFFAASFAEERVVYTQRFFWILRRFFRSSGTRPVAGMRRRCGIGISISALLLIHFPLFFQQGSSFFRFLRSDFLCNEKQNGLDVAVGDKGRFAVV